MPSRLAFNALLSAAAFSAGLGAAHLVSGGTPKPGNATPTPADHEPAAEPNGADAHASAPLPHSPAEITDRFAAILSEGDYYRQNKAFALALRDLRPEDIEPALAAMEKDGTWRQQWFKAAIITKWADFDPIAAADYALQQPPLSSRPPDPAIAASFEKWAARDEASALQRATAIENAAQQRAAIRGAILPFMQRDPQAALAWMQSLPPAARDHDLYRAAFGAWAQKNPQAAAQGAIGIADPESRKVALRGVATKWVASAPNAAAAWAASLPDPVERASAQNSVFGRWAFLDPQAAASAAAPLLPRDTKPPDFYYSIVDEMIERNSQGALKFARASADGEEATRRWTQAISRCAFQDPVTALAEAKKIPSGENQCEVFNELFRYLPYVASPEDAVQFAVRELPEIPTRKDVVLTGLRTWVGFGDGEAAMNFAAAQPNLPPEAMAYTFEMWSMNHPDAAMAWAQARPDSAEKKAFIETTLPYLARRFPEEAVGLLAQSAPAARSQLIGEIAATWSGADPARAAAWASQLTNTGERAVAWEKLTENWSSTRPVEAATWLKTLPAGTDRDTAAAAYARTVLGIDPDAAIAWAGSIANPAQRNETLRKAYLHWRQFDPKAAGDWLQTTSDFAAEAKLSLQNEP